MAGRFAPLRDPVVFTLDGERIVGERGEPVAASLIAAGKLTLARSPKFHRPRGPACMRGACDGCLARVDGVPNVMTCLTPAAEGLAVTSQNSLGSREVDLLRVTDWFFADGMNHHELFAGVPGVQSAMQLFARRVAGLGRLPEGVRPTATAARRRVAVLVIGAGAAGMAIAAAAAENGQRVEVIDDGLVPGGSTLALGADDEATAGFRAIRRRFDRAVAADRVRVSSRTVAAGIFGRDVLVVGERVEVIEATALIIAAGAHDGVVPFENNDFPGVMSARAGALLVAGGVSLGKKVVLLEPPREAVDPEAVAFGDVFDRAVARYAAGAAPTRLTRLTPAQEVVRANGSTHLRAVIVRESSDGGGGPRERSISADALLVDAPRSPAYELCEQVGATLEHRPAGYVPRSDRGRIADGVWAIGEVTGMPLAAARFVAAAEEIAAQLG
jgi:sarcosine oxidase subunit alpha